MKINEKYMQVLFGDYIRKNPPEQSEVYELKFTSGKSMRFAELKEHQREALASAESSGVYHRITDQPWIKDRPYAYTLKKPFDCFFIKSNAYVVVWFYQPREPKVFHLIAIGDFLRMEKLITEMGTMGRKSFKEFDAVKFASLSIKISN